jgi:hypothetical protein
LEATVNTASCLVLSCHIRKWQGIREKVGVVAVTQHDKKRDEARRDGGDEERGPIGKMENAM